MSTNPELELAHRYVSETDRHVFLTGKAGTGKTTFLHNIRETIAKRKVVVAPTGVAAINAAGVTIHSQFQLPFGVLHPDRLAAELRKHQLSRKKAEVLNGMDLLIIDEISMVRADVLDALSAVLKKYRRDHRPFGGVQLLMIGDLHQLPPVVRDEEWQELRPHYDTPYFFGSLELKRAGIVTIQLKHIYRQSDSTFIDLLNRVRHNQMDATVLKQLNSRYRGPEYTPEGGDYITLTSHNRTAKTINERQLEKLTTPLHTFTATIEGTFPASMYPNEPQQRFRVGAQVMFNKNDPSGGQYYNGKIGRIVAIQDDKIRVRCPDEAPIEVVPVAWENRKYEVNKQSKEVTDEVIGTFTQHPLRLAWAITIHKSQGLTFDRVIIDAAAAFAHGQVYVALSRCKTFEGIVLRSRIEDHSIHTDKVVSAYSTRAAEEAPSEESLRADRRVYELNSLRELFDFATVEQSMARLERALFEHENSLQGTALPEIRSIRERLEKEIKKACRGFSHQLSAYAREEHLPTEHPELRRRLTKAGDYLVPKLKDLCVDLGQLSFMSDNQKVYESVAERLQAAGKEMVVKLRTLETLQAGFTPERFVRARADAALNFDKQPDKSRPARPPVTTANCRHPELYEQLAEWRRQRAAASDIPPYRVLHNTVLLAVADVLPMNREELLSISGVGPKSYTEYGTELLEMVENYAADLSEEKRRNRTTLPAIPSAPRLPTREVSLTSFQAGRSVAEIARERGLKESTIFSHLAHWVAEGVLKPETLIEPARLAKLTDYFSLHPETETLKEVHEHFGGEFTYNELRLAADVTRQHAASNAE